VGTPAYPSPLGSQRSPRPLRGRWLQLGGRARWLLLGLATLGALLLAAPLLAAYLIEKVVIPRLNERYGVLIQVERVAVRPTRVRLAGLSVRAADAAQLTPPLRTRRCEVEFTPLALLRGQLELTTVSLDGASIQVSRGGDEDNISALLTRLRRRTAEGSASAAATGSGRLHGPQTVVVTAAELEVRDDLGSVRAAAMEATLRRQGDCQVSLHEAAVEPASGATASAEEVVVRWRSPERFLPVGLPVIELRGGAVTPWKRLAMTGIRGTIKADPSAGTRAAIELAGGYGGVDKELWQARGWVQPPTEGPWSRAEAELSLRAERFQLSQLEPILKNTPIIDADKTAVDASLELKFGQGALSFGGSFQMAGLSVFSPRLVAEPVRDLGFNITANGRLELKTRKLRLDRAAIKWNGAEVDIDADAEAQPLHQVPPSPAGTPPGWRERWRTVALHIVVPPIDCQAMLAAMPQPIVPRIRDFKLAGTFSTDVRVFVDFAKLLRLPPPRDLDDEEGGADAIAPTAPETAPPPPPLAPLPAKKSRRGGAVAAAAPAKDPKDDPVQVSGQVGIGGCRVLKAPPEMEASRFLTSFTHTVLVEPGRELSFVIGPQNPDYVPYEELSPYLINSIMTTEDNGFLRHRGFITPEFRSALQSNLERGYFRLGASSITMQMVKNVLLSREKTLSRKLQEMFLTWYLETNLVDDPELIKALNKGFSVSQYRQQQAKLKKPVPEASVPAAAPPPSPPLPVAPAVPTAGPPPTPAAAAATSVLAVAKPFEGAPTGQSNLYAVAQARQALREISPIKKRILEIYFNAIEFGPYIYGIGRATRHYFGKPPKDLTPREASFFSSILPSPKRRYIQYCKGAADEGWEKYVDRIVRRVHSRGRLTDEELQQAVQDRLVFDRAEALPDKDCLALVQHFAELPPPTLGPAPEAGSGDKAPPPLPPEKLFPPPPWIAVQSGGRLRYKPPTKPETVPEVVPF
jgi:hypothetical protein